MAVSEAHDGTVVVGVFGCGGLFSPLWQLSAPLLPAPCRSGLNSIPVCKAHGGILVVAGTWCCGSLSLLSEPLLPLLMPVLLSLLLLLPPSLNIWCRSCLDSVRVSEVHFVTVVEGVVDCCVAASLLLVSLLSLLAPSSLLLPIPSLSL